LSVVQTQISIMYALPQQIKSRILLHPSAPTGGAIPSGYHRLVFHDRHQKHDGLLYPSLWNYLMMPMDKICLFTYKYAYVILKSFNMKIIPETPANWRNFMIFRSNQ
jgi:hypothetical protein